jgi:hypothetical protein
MFVLGEIFGYCRSFVFWPVILDVFRYLDGDVLITHHPGNSLDHPTHTDRYLHTALRHPPAYKKSIITTLVDRAIRLQ